jgi:hypothetical protein
LLDGIIDRPGSLRNIGFVGVRNWLDTLESRRFGCSGGCTHCHRRLLRLLAVSIVAGTTAEQDAPGSVNSRDGRAIDIAGRIVFGDRHKGISQLQRAHSVLLGRFHNFDECLIEAAMT